VNYQLVSIVVPHASHDMAEVQAIERHIQTNALQVLLLKDMEVVDCLKALVGTGQEPAVVIIGPGISHAITVARNVRAVWPTGQILFMPGHDLYEKVQQDLRHAPMIGPNWSLLELDDPAFVRKIQRAVSSSQQRVRLRTTLDKVNIQLSAPKPVDSLEYRRTVISEHYLASLLQQSSDAIISLDRHHTVLYWSAGAERMFGLSASAVQKQPVSSLPFWAATLDPFLAQIHSGGQSAKADVKCRIGERNAYLEVSFSRVHDENNVFIGTSLAVRDVSEQYKVLEAERNARQDAERISRLKDEFLAILSHELRTPLSAVIGRTQLLKMQHRNSPDLLSALTVIERNAQLQAKLIEDLLDVSSIITGKLQLDLQPISIAKAVSAAIESVKHLAEGKKIWLIEPPYVPDTFVQGDPFRLQQILYNLLSNAIKFTPESGQVRLDVTRTASNIEITVQDNGCGISPDFLPMVFERFGQEDASITRRHGGLGLGLSIVKKLVDLHGGSIRAASPGRDLGASFTVSFPIHSSSGEPGQLRLAAIESGGDVSSTLHSCRILLVEDVADARALVVDVLQAHGAEVVAVESAAAALRALDDFVPDILVSDIGMAEMDGYELIKQIRSQGITNEKLPAIALTAFASSADRARALVSGFQSHVAKPLIVSDLVNTVSRLIQCARQ
jgi:PAS domain S-box-containing protein